MKDNILYTIIVSLIIWLVVSDCSNKNKQNRLLDELTEQNKTIVAMDKTTKEKDGQYTKLVDYFNTEKQLLNELKSDNKDLYKTIKNQNERLLMLNKTVITLQGSISEGFISINQNDTNVFDISLKYPNEGDSFINWDGSLFIKNKKYSGNWSFDELPLQIILTETERGLWKTRLIGPEWLVVDSIQVKSLPPTEFDNKTKQQKMRVYIGGGVIRIVNQQNTIISLGGGLGYKNHSIIINGMSNQSLGFNYYYNFSNFNKK
jgi:uncharacterized membrane-anchored protein YhcB (DUF1043 family)